MKSAYELALERTGGKLNFLSAFKVRLTLYFGFQHGFY